MKMIMDDAIMEAIVAKLLEIQDQENVNIPLYERELRETSISIENMLNAIQQGILTRSLSQALPDNEAKQALLTGGFSNIALLEYPFHRLKQGFYPLKQNRFFS